MILPLVFIAIKYKKSHTSPERSPPARRFPISPWVPQCCGLWSSLVPLASAEVTVWSAKTIAQSMGISELVIGLTVVAIGTSSPELAASAVSALRGHHDIAIGNVFGSNLFNIMLVMTSAGAISPIALSPEVFSRTI